MDRDALISECKRRRGAGADTETLIALLRSAGCSKIDSIAVLVAVCDVSLGAAKQLVHLSPTWGDTRIADDAFHATLVDTLGGVEETE